MTLPMAVFGIPFPAQSSGFSLKKSKFENKLKNWRALPGSVSFVNYFFLLNASFIFLIHQAIILHQAHGFMT